MARTDIDAVRDVADANESISPRLGLPQLEMTGPGAQFARWPRGSWVLASMPQNRSAFRHVQAKQRPEVGTDRDWLLAANIGQAYGAVSAVLSGLALLGGAWSIRFQVKDHVAMRHQVARTQHFRLLELTLEDPELYIPAWGSPHTGRMSGKQGS